MAEDCPGYTFCDWLVDGCRIEPRQACCPYILVLYTYSFFKDRILQGQPDDQIHSEVIRIMETINIRTGYKGGDGFWWIPEIFQYAREPSEVGHNNS